MTKPPTDVATALRVVVDLIAGGLPMPAAIDPGHPRMELQFHRDETSAVDEWAAAMGAAAEVHPHVFAEGARSWQTYQAFGTLAGHPVRVWGARTVTQ